MTSLNKLLNPRSRTSSPTQGGVRKTRRRKKKKGKERKEKVEKRKNKTIYYMESDCEIFIAVAFFSTAILLKNIYIMMVVN